MVSLQQGLRADGIHVSMAQLCRWFEQPRRTVYHRPPKVKSELAEPIEALIEAEPSFGYRTVAGLLEMNKNTVQRIFQLKGWQVRKRAVGHRPRIEALPSVAQVPDERWATDLCRAWAWDRVIPFFAFPPAVRRIVYTTNAIESLHNRLRKIIKTRGHFPNDDAATMLIWLALRNITADWGLAAAEWREAMNQFAIAYSDRFTRPAA